MRVVALQDGSLATSRNYNHESTTAEGGTKCFSDKDSYIRAQTRVIPQHMRALKTIPQAENHLRWAMHMRLTEFTAWRVSEDVRGRAECHR